MVAELDLQQDYLGEEIKTIYFGGGTPSLLRSDEIHTLLDAIAKYHKISAEVEITLEANPDDITLKYATELKDTGINRLSIGVQSVRNNLLRFLNRAHDAQSGRSAFEAARRAGFTNISIDLIYSIPGLEDAQWVQDISMVLSLNPEHISCYSLTIEEKTVFGHWTKTGKLNPIDDEVTARQFELLIYSLEAAGYNHYEISNFAKPGYYSRHNSSYWKLEKYLGIGPSAHSFNTVSRQYNVKNNYKYVKSVREGVVPAEIEILTIEDKINEFVLTTLRTNWGTDFSIIESLYQYSLLKDKSEYIQQLLNTGLGRLENQTLILTRKGKLFADKIAADLFVNEI